MNETSQLILGSVFAVCLAWPALAIWLRGGVRRDPELPPAIPSGKVATWFYHPGDLIGAMVIYLVLTGMFALTAVSPPMDPDQISAGALAIGIGFHLILTAMVATSVMRRCSPNQWLGLRWSGWPWLFLIGPGVVILMGLINWVILRSGYIDWMKSLEMETVQDPVAILKQTRDPVVLGLMILAATVMAPLWEEIVFRGYLHPVLKRFGGFWTGALCSSLFFSAVHNNAAALLPLFILGLLLAWLYEKTGSIWTPIAIHFCFNATAVLVILYGPADLPQALIPL